MVDRFGPRWVVMVGGILVAMAWVLNSLGELVAAAVLRRCARRHRHRLRLRHLRRQRAQMVSGQTWTCRRCDRFRVRCGRGAHGRADQDHDRVFGLRAGIFGVRPHSRRHRVRDVVAAVDAARRRLPAAVVKPNQTAHGYTPVDVLQSPVFYVMYLMMVLVAFGGLTIAGIDGADCRGFQNRQDSGRVVRHGPACARLCTLFESNFRWHRPAVFRLVVRSNRPRIHHGAGIFDRCCGAVHLEPIRIESGDLSCS